METFSGRNYAGKLVIGLLILIILISFLIRLLISIAILVFGLCFLFVILFVRFKRIDIYENRFEIVRQNIIPIFSGRDVFRYEDLMDVYFEEGYTNWFYVIIRTNADQTTYSRPDMMIVLTRKDKRIEINRIGTKRDFKNAVAMVKERIQKTEIE